MLRRPLGKTGATVSGTKRPHYVIENAAAAGIKLTPDEIAALDELFDPAAVAGDRYPAAAMAHVERA